MSSSEDLRSMLTELQQAVDRSSVEYTHLAVDKAFIGRLIDAGRAVATGYDEGLIDSAELERYRGNGNRDYSGVDPTFVA